MHRTLALAIMCTSLAAAPVAADDMVTVPAGAFWMGADDGPAAERPRHNVALPAFRIGRVKVTNQAFAAFLQSEGLRDGDGRRRYDDDDRDARIHLRDGRWTADPGYGDHPAVEVSWFGARDFCAWRGRRLPSEAEWEKAARGTDGRTYPWGEAAPDAERAVLGRGWNQTLPGADRPAGASPYGVLDMLGNLREWTASRLAPYPFDPAAPAWTGSGEVVIRGAAHDDRPEDARITRRHSYALRGASAGHHHVGFRCAEDAR